MTLKPPLLAGWVNTRGQDNVKRLSSARERFEHSASRHTETRGDTENELESNAMGARRVQ